MTRHYTIRDLFRRVPNNLLSRYFHQQKLFTELDFTGMKETQPDKLFQAWIELPDDRRKILDSELKTIFEMSCPKGFQAIIDEARWQMQDSPDECSEFIESLSALPSHYHRAMVAYLDHHECWKGATRFYQADSLSWWRKRKNLGHRPADVSDSDIQQLTVLIRDYFHRTEGRGNNCVVEPYRRGELDYFFAYPEDYSQQQPEWINGEFDNRPHTPAFVVVFIYSQKEGTLDLNFRGPRKAVEPLQNIFATAILKQDDLPPSPRDERVYDLNPLRHRDFNFIFDPGSGIEKVSVRKVRLSSRVTQGERITLEVDTANNPLSVYDLLDKIGKSTPPHRFNVTQIELGASMVVDADKPPKLITIRITHPNSCSLKYDERDLKLRQMLASSGIEPKEPERGEGDDQ